MKKYATKILTIISSIYLIVTILVSIELVDAKKAQRESFINDIKKYEQEYTKKVIEQWQEEQSKK